MSSKHESWTRYPYTDQTATYPSWRNDLKRTFSTITSEVETSLAYGMGRSYGDSCHAVSNRVLAMSCMDKFIQANWDAGIIIAEAGVTLDDVLRISIPNGWFLPVSPGTKYVTLGGAVANDVHGKNHSRRGTFGNHVRSLSLVRSDQGRITCSRTENSELFASTIGGLGLSGIIESVELALTKIDSSRLHGTVQRFGSLSEYFELASDLVPQNEYAAAWVDCGTSGKSLGRGVYTALNHRKDGPLKHEDPSHLTVPITPPLSMINKFTVTTFNYLYWSKQSRYSKKIEMGYESFLYPLDRILEWNRIYGPLGFQQYQCVIPTQDAYPAIQQLIVEIAKSGLGSVLSVLKTFGEVESEGLLSFPMAGTTLALDFPNKTNPERLNRLFLRLDSIVLEANGRLYPAKDAHMKGADFREFYPEWEKIEHARDKSICSSFWQRVIQ